MRLQAAVLVASIVIISGCVSQQETIKIGVIAPLSGGPSLWGQGSLDMITLAVDEINQAGGIGGKRLEIIAEDGRCSPAAATSAAQKLIQVDGVKFILGGHCSSETVAIAPIAQENGVFMLASVSTATGILDDYDYAFRTSPPNLEQGKKIATLALRKYNLTRIATLTEQTIFAQSISDDFVEAYAEEGGTILIEETFPTEQRDFRTELTKIRERNPDAIFISSQDPKVGVELLRQVSELGMNTRLFGTTVFVSLITYTDSNGSLPPDAFTAAVYADPQNPKTQELVDKYKARFNKDVPYVLFFVGAAYDGAYMLKESLEECGEDPACVRDHFFTTKDWEGSVATYSFKKNGDPAISNWQELRIVDGKEVFEEIA